MPGEVKVLTRTEVKTIRDLEVHMPAMDIANPDEQTEDSIGPDTSDLSQYDETTSQSDQFERSMAGEPEVEPSSAPEETSSGAPEEAPPEIIPIEESSDN